MIQNKIILNNNELYILKRIISFVLYDCNDKLTTREIHKIKELYEKIEKI